MTLVSRVIPPEARSHLRRARAGPHSITCRGVVVQVDAIAGSVHCGDRLLGTFTVVRNAGFLKDGAASEPGSHAQMDPAEAISGLAWSHKQEPG